MFSSAVSSNGPSDDSPHGASISEKINEPFELCYKNFMNPDCEKPFGEDKLSSHKIAFRPKIRGFSLKGMPYRIISERSKEYLSQGRVEQAIKASHMKRIFSQAINGYDDVQALLELSEVAVNQK